MARPLCCPESTEPYTAEATPERSNEFATCVALGAVPRWPIAAWSVEALRLHRGRAVHLYDVDREARP